MFKANLWFAGLDVSVNLLGEDGSFSKKKNMNIL